MRYVIATEANLKIALMKMIKSEYGVSDVVHRKAAWDKFFKELLKTSKMMEDDLRKLIAKETFK